jgi:hypothetical protein
MTLTVHADAVSAGKSGAGTGRRLLRSNLREFDQMTIDEDEAKVSNAMDVVVRGARGACSAFCLFRSVACARECSVCIFDVEAAGQALVDLSMTFQSAVEPKYAPELR